MHKQALEKYQHSHDFTPSNPVAEKRTGQVLALTAVMMVIEIIAGTMLGSMALLADGWHMGTHVAAFLISIFAYRYARKHAHSNKLTFGPGKVSVLGGFASAITLGVVALLMCAESIQRVFNPHTIHFDEAIGVAVIGLMVNLISALLLKDGHHHHSHDHAHHHHDHNLRAAYMHVIADALTSLLAIVALLSGKYFAWFWLDPVMGIVGAIIITRWSITLLKETAPILLDSSIDTEYLDSVKEALERSDDNRVSDLHIWKVGANHYAAIISLVTHSPKPVMHYKALLQDFHKLSHLTIEVNMTTCMPHMET
ncbi:MAG: CDF family Co(II)/Ni(II) efflux transporter DmeF [Mariprofundus sp.]|nr:CDF family Co(II)/Ni(II) efflux transporter DmeF [Mariprofundus sp.]